jgi:hypothetical protein
MDPKNGPNNEIVKENKQIIDEYCKVIDEQMIYYCNKLKEHEQLIKIQNEKINILEKKYKHIIEKELKEEWDLHIYTGNALILFYESNKSFSVNTEKVDIFRNLLKDVLLKRKIISENDLVNIIEPSKISNFIKAFNYIQHRVTCSNKIIEGYEEITVNVIDTFSKDLDTGIRKSEMGLYEGIKLIYNLYSIKW